MLELRGLGKTWPLSKGAGGTEVLRDVHLLVPPGQTVAVLGVSGGGKSTLLRIIAGIESATQGEVLWCGERLDRQPMERRGVGMVFQDYALFPHLDAIDNVAFGLIEQGVSKKDAREMAQAWLQRMAVPAVRGQRIWTLSGGEQQRAALARCLIVRPRVLLLDEPLSAIDAGMRMELRADFVRRIEQERTATIWVTHDEQEARAVASKGYLLADAQLRQIW